VLPRFAGRLAALLGDPDPAWPVVVDLVPAGTEVNLSDQVYFTAQPRPESAEQTWLTGVVRETLGLPGTAAVAGRTLLALGTSSLQAVAIQYQILQRWDVDLPAAQLLSERDVAAIARLLTTEVTG
jgi:methionyl-tRNA synthetase